MTTYNVHIFRAMRLYYPDIEADTPEKAAETARRKTTDEAESTEDCDGQDFGALVDRVGDEDHEHSVWIDFEPERQRRAAPLLRDALHSLLEQTVDMDLKYGIGLSDGEEAARRQALAAIACFAAAEEATINEEERP
jgi:hypothetical protein